MKKLKKSARAVETAYANSKTDKLIENIDLVHYCDCQRRYSLSNYRKKNTNVTTVPDVTRNMDKKDSWKSIWHCRQRTE